MSFTIASLTVSQNMGAQAALNDFKGTQLQWSQELRIKLLSHALKNFGNKKFETPEVAEAFIRNCPDQLANKLTEAQTGFQNELKKLLDNAANFTNNPSSSED